MDAEEWALLEGDPCKLCGKKVLHLNGGICDACRGKQEEAQLEAAKKRHARALLSRGEISMQQLRGL